MKFSPVVLAGLAPLAAAQPVIERQNKPGGQSAPLPFIEAQKSPGVCFPGELEQCIGTKQYCETKGWTREDEPKQYASAEACLADRQPQPRSLLPFIAKNEYPGVCFPGELEQCIGTKQYCKTKGWTREDEPKQYASTDECFADRQPQLGSAGNGDGATATATATTLKADIRGDTNRDGVVDIEGSSDVKGKDQWSETSGAIFLANIGDSGDRCKSKFGSKEDRTPIRTQAACHDASDDEQRAPQYMAPLRTVPISGLGDSATATVMVSDDKVRPLVRIFCQRGHGWEIVKDDTVFSANEVRHGLTLGIDAREPRLPGGWDGRASVDFMVRDGDVTAKDTVMLRVAPVLLHHHRQAVKKVFAASLPDISGRFKVYIRNLMKGIKASMQKANVPGLIFEMPTMDVWTQDYFEPGYTSMPGPNGTTTSLRIMIQGRHGERNAVSLLYNHLRGDGVGGNIETIPPYEFNGKKFPAGRVVLGGDENHMPNVREFFDTQETQDPLIFDTTWLYVKHFDEIIQFVPTKTERGWAAMVVDPQFALAMLRDAQRDGSGNQSMTSVETDNSFPTIDEFLADESNIQDVELVSERMSANIELLKKETGITDGEIFRVPALFGHVTKIKGLNLSRQRGSNKPKSTRSTVKGSGEEQADAELNAAFAALVPPHVPVDDSPSGIEPAALRRQAQAKQSVDLDSYFPSLVNGLPLSDSVYLAPKPHGPKVNGNDIFEGCRHPGVPKGWLHNGRLCH